MLLLTNTQVLKLRKAFANNSLADIKLSKTQMQLGGFLDIILGPLIKTGLLLKKNVLKPLAKRVLISLVLTAPASATDSAIQKKTFGSGVTMLIISN